MSVGIHSWSIKVEITSEFKFDADELKSIKTDLKTMFEAFDCDGVTDEADELLQSICDNQM
jgi:hypothetical protein